MWKDVLKIPIDTPAPLKELRQPMNLRRASDFAQGNVKKRGRPSGRKSQKTMLFPNFASQTKDFLKSLSI